MLKEEELKALQSLGVCTTNKEVRNVLYSSFIRLLPFQKEGVRLLLKRGAKSCLFDECGLGKSIQALVAVLLRSFSEKCFAKGEVVLIVCPAMLKINWWSMIEEWLPFLDIDDVLMIDSKKQAATDTLHRIGKKIVIVSYAVLETFVENTKLIIHSIILDESHVTKNFMSKRTLNIVSLRTKNLLLLSGNPVQKKPVDIIAQVVLSLSCDELLTLDQDSVFLESTDILNTIFNLKDFFFVQKYFSKHRKRVIKRTKVWKTDINVLEKELRQSDLKQLEECLLTFVDFISTCFVALKVSGSIKHHFYADIRKKHFFQPSNSLFSFEVLVSLVRGLKSFHEKYHRELESMRSKLTFLFCCHQLMCVHSEFSVQLIRGKRASKQLFVYGNKFSDFFFWFFKARCIRRLKSEVLVELPSKLYKIHYVTYNKQSNFNEACAFPKCNDSTGENAPGIKKLAELLQLHPSEIQLELKNIAFKKISSCVEYISNVCAVSEQKCVIFAKHLSFIEALMICLSKELPGINVLCITGNTSPNERMRAIKRFDSGLQNQLLILSIGANSLGFDLKSVTRVLVCELLWCSEQMEQAEDRVHRIGQQASCIYITYLILQCSFEEMLFIILKNRKKVINQFWKKLHLALCENVAAKIVPLSLSIKVTTWQDNELLGFRMNMCTNRVHVYLKISNHAPWTQLKMNFDFEQCLQMCAPVKKNETKLITALHAFALEWTQLSAKEKKKVCQLAKPCYLPLKLNLDYDKQQSKNQFDAVNCFERFTHPDLQMHASAMLRVPNNYLIKDVTLNSNETTRLAQNLLSGYFMCKYCGKDLSLTTQEGINFESLFCEENGKKCHLKYMLKCCRGRARGLLRDIDHGVCRLCKVDTLHLLQQCTRYASSSGFRLASLTCPLLDSVGDCSHVMLSVNNDLVKSHWTSAQLEEFSVSRKKSIENAKHLKESHFWEADHIMAVKLGGPSIEENFQTLCTPCHMKKTKLDRKKILLFKRNTE